MRLRTPTRRRDPQTDRHRRFVRQQLKQHGGRDPHRRRTLPAVGRPYSSHLRSVSHREPPTRRVLSGGEAGCAPPCPAWPCGGGTFQVSVLRDAAAGALAGVAVSLVLHPVDTVKVLVQARKSAPTHDRLAGVLASRGGMLLLYWCHSACREFASRRIHRRSVCIPRCAVELFSRVPDRRPLSSCIIIAQAQRGAERQPLQILRRALAERGVHGLYAGLGVRRHGYPRGRARRFSQRQQRESQRRKMLMRPSAHPVRQANLAASAPISAIYVSTYESVRRQLAGRVPQVGSARPPACASFVRDA